MKKNDFFYLHCEYYYFGLNEKYKNNEKGKQNICFHRNHTKPIKQSLVKPSKVCISQCMNCIMLQTTIPCFHGIGGN